MSESDNESGADIAYAEAQSNPGGAAEGYCSDEDILAVLGAAGVSDGNVA